MLFLFDGMDMHDVVDCTSCRMRMKVWECGVCYLCGVGGKYAV